MRIRTWVIAAALLAAWPVTAAAQNPIIGRTVQIGTFAANCKMSNGSSSPNSSVTGSPCDLYLQTTGSLWLKATGSNTNTGWVKLNAACGSSKDIQYNTSGQLDCDTGLFTYDASIHTLLVNAMRSQPVTGGAPGADGTDLTVKAADAAAGSSGGTSNTGGALNLIAGAGANNAGSGPGGAANLTGGLGSGNGPGGAVNVSGGAAAGGGTIANGGPVNITSGTEGSNAGTTGAVTIKSANSVGTLGASGDVTIASGNSSAVSTPGTITIKPGTPAVTSNGTANVGAPEVITGGKGGGSNGVLTNTAGAGGPLNLTGGAGGAAAGSSSTATAGAGAPATLAGGPGGNATGSGTLTGGAGGDVVLKPGAGGTGAAANGSDGIMHFKSADGSTVDCQVSVAGSNLSWTSNCGVGGTGTVTHTGGALTANAPVIGAAGGDVAVGSRSGNTTTFATTTGPLTAGNCIKSDANGNLVDVGSTCGSGTGADPNGYYLVSRSTNAPTNAVNLGALTTGLIKCTVASSICTPSTATAGTDYSTPSSSDTLTNKTFDVEATGNVFTMPVPIAYVAAVCQGATAALGFSTPASNAATATCVTGSNTQFGVATFANSGASHVQGHFTLPTDWSGAIDLKGKWRTSATSGNIVWNLATACVADGATSDPSFNSPNQITDAAKGSANQQNDFSTTGLTTTGCSAGYEFYFDFYRDKSNGSDTAAASADLISLVFILRRAM